MLSDKEFPGGIIIHTDESGCGPAARPGNLEVLRAAIQTLHRTQIELVRHVAELAELAGDTAKLAGEIAEQVEQLKCTERSQ